MKLDAKKKYRVKGKSMNCGYINRIYLGCEIYFDDNPDLNGYVSCVANQYSNNPRFRTAKDVVIEEIKDENIR